MGLGTKTGGRPPGPSAKTLKRGEYVRIFREAGGFASDETIYRAMGGKLDHLPESERRERARKAASTAGKRP